MKQRHINVKFWTDNYIIDLDAEEKLLFLYCLTNSHSDVCGIYELPMAVIVFETGMSKKKIISSFSKFEECGRIIWREGWLAIRNFIKHHRQTDNPEDNMNKAIDNGLDKAPENLKIWCEGGEAPPTPLIRPFQSFTFTSSLTLTSTLKHSYMKFVTLTTDEFFKLRRRFGRAGTRDWCEALNLWKGSKGKKTASDYLTILNWERRDKKEGKPGAVVQRKASTLEEIEKMAGVKT